MNESASNPGAGPANRASAAAAGPSATGAGASTAVVGGLTFDQALEELQATVARLEAGGQPLEEAIALYERGVALHEQCARLLADAELRVRRLVERAGGALETIAVDAEAGELPG
jgi:exodeoxyribonuclease VII small subunit